jgi:hypothetical protein
MKAYPFFVIIYRHFFLKETNDYLAIKGGIGFAADHIIINLKLSDVQSIIHFHPRAETP